MLVVTQVKITFIIVFKLTTKKKLCILQLVGFLLVLAPTVLRQIATFAESSTASALPTVEHNLRISLLVPCNGLVVAHHLFGQSAFALFLWHLGREEICRWFNDAPNLKLEIMTVHRFNRIAYLEIFGEHFSIRSFVMLLWVESIAHLHQFQVTSPFIVQFRRGKSEPLATCCSLPLQLSSLFLLPLWTCQHFVQRALIIVLCDSGFWEQLNKCGICVKIKLNLNTCFSSGSSGSKPSSTLFLGFTDWPLLDVCCPSSPSPASVSLWQRFSLGTVDISSIVESVEFQPSASKCSSRLATKSCVNSPHSRAICKNWCTSSINRRITHKIV